MRIVHVEDYFWATFGYQLNFLAKWNRIHGHDIHIVASDSFAPFVASGVLSESETVNWAASDKEYSQKYNVSITREKSFGRYSSREFLTSRIFDTVAQKKPDIVMLHGSDSLTAIRFLRKARYLPYPVVTDNHMASVASENKLRDVFRVAYRRLVTPHIVKNNIPVVALAEDIKEYCINQYAVPSHQISVVSWGVDTTLFHPDKKARNLFRCKHNISESDFVLVYTGKITSSKKVGLLARATQERFSNGKNVVILLVGGGSGKYYEHTMSFFRNSKNRVITFPIIPVTELPPFYQASDIAVWPGACSLSFFDAQACGLPVIAENIDANRLRITPERDNGALYYSDDWQALRNEIERFLSMPADTIRCIGKNGYQFVFDNFNYDKIALEIEAIMQFAIERHSR